MMKANTAFGEKETRTNVFTSSYAIIFKLKNKERIFEKGLIENMIKRKMRII